MVSKKKLQDTIDNLHMEMDNLRANYNYIIAQIKAMEDYNYQNNEINKMKTLKAEIADDNHKEEEENLAGRLIHVGAFDVAKSYIDFLKDKAKKAEEKAKQHVTVSPIGRKTMKKNNGADFGPDTKGTKTSGLQGAINKAMNTDKDVKLVD